MNRGILQRLVDTHITALFPGISIREDTGNPHQHKPAVFSKGQSEIRIREIDGMSFYISRAQPFNSQELKIVHDIVAIADEYSGLSLDTQTYLSAGSLGRMVARSLTTSAEDTQYQTLISLIIETLEKWSAQTYEGSRIATSLGVNPDAGGDRNDFDAFVREDFSRVLSNGYDTLIEFNSRGELIGHESLESINDTKETPFRYAAFSAYTNSTDRLAFVLNRNGEILVFRKGSLFFAKRRGDWRLFTHDSLLKQLAFGNRIASQSLQEAVYASALDVSFARCGGCIGVVHKSKLSAFLNDSILKDGDKLASADNPKVLALRKSVASKTFQEIDRRIRQEILGIDGATVLDHEGKILAAGAILNISQKETLSAGGGARLAAARVLGKYGYAVKVSADGEIRAIGKKGEAEFRYG